MGPYKVGDETIHLSSTNTFHQPAKQKKRL